MLKNLAIVGGGPAGLYLAWLLQDKGYNIMLFDPRIPFEKPCGGGITFKAIDQFKMLGGISTLSRSVNKFQFISPFDSQCDIACEVPMQIISRKTLSEYQLNLLNYNRVNLVHAKVTEIKRNNDGFTLTTVSDGIHLFDKKYEADFVVGADGAHGISRRWLGAMPFGTNRYSGLGYYVEGLCTDTAIIKFYKRSKGYLWVFPRGDHSSVGFFSLSRQFSKDLALTNVKEFLKKYFPTFTLNPEKYYSATIPLVWKWQRENVQGENWALIGDAGGFVDTITGEGIYYAFKSAELLAKAISENNPEKYYDYSFDMIAELQKSADIFNRFYKTWFTSAMVLLCKRSHFLQQVLVNLVLGRQSYSALKSTLKQNIPKVAREVMLSFMAPPASLGRVTK